MSVENQKIIRIKKTEVDRNFLKLSKEEMYEAMRKLTGSELKLYLYLAANKVDYQLELSRSYLIEQGITSNGSYDRAVKGLIEKRYLVPLSPGSNIFYFYTVSQNGSGQQAGNLRNSQSGKTVPETGAAVPRAGTESPKIEKEINTYIPINKIDNGGGVSDKEKEYAERLGLEVEEKCGPAAVKEIRSKIQEMLANGATTRERYNKIIELCKSYLGDTEK